MLQITTTHISTLSNINHLVTNVSTHKKKTKLSRLEFSQVSIKELYLYTVEWLAFIFIQLVLNKHIC